MTTESRPVAYFSMEVGLDPSIPTYAGGLGVLAGDTLRSAADLGLPLVGVTLLHRRGYFTQRIGPDGAQIEEPTSWEPERRLREEPAHTRVEIAGRKVTLRAFRLDLRGDSGDVVPVFFLDTDLPDNAPEDRALTHHLYGGGDDYRLAQEIVLGIGGVRMLRALGWTDLRKYHMNEGHSSFLALELLAERERVTGRVEAVEVVRRQCVFTTHTPVPAGHDRFSFDDVARFLSDRDVDDLRPLITLDGEVNMTWLALNLSHFVNGVAKMHGEVSRSMFQQPRIDAITNGVDANFWASPPFADLYDELIPGWRTDHASLRYALDFPLHRVRHAHGEAKRSLVDLVNAASPGAGFDEETPTLGFARRMTPYKRASLLFHDPARLRAIAEAAGGLQLVFAGKAHPHDGGGKALIREIHAAREALGPHVRLVFLPDYGMGLARTLVAGVDVWLNTPLPPLEASGTSGMKAAVNGVPQLGTLDGWWLEGCIEGRTGWAIERPGLVAGPTAWRNGNGLGHANHGAPAEPPVDEAADTEASAASLYEKLEEKVLPLLADTDALGDVMRHCIALNGSFFSSQRMLSEYVRKAYFR